MEFKYKLSVWHLTEESAEGAASTRIGSLLCVNIKLTISRFGSGLFCGMCSDCESAYRQKRAQIMMSKTSFHFVE